MLSVSASVCSHPIHVGSAAGLSQARIGGSARGYVFRISAMSDPSNQNSENPHHHSTQIPKLEPFNRGRISRRMREPSLLEKAENAIMDHCSSLEAEESYKCWETLFEFEKMKEECEVQCNTASSENRSTDCRPLERIENMVRQSGGVKSLIDTVSMVAETSKLQKEAHTQEKITVPVSEELTEDAEYSKRYAFPEPDDLPKTNKELEEEEKARMPDSPYTKMLRQIGHFASFRS